MTAPTLATYGFFVDWDGDGDFSEAPEDISEYVLTASWEYGLDFTAPQGRSKIGQIRLKLDNSSSIFSSYNTASPINSGLNAVLPNRLVKITMDTGGGAQTMFQGYLVTILPSPGPVVSISTAELVAYGPLSQTQKAEVHLAMQTDYRTDQAFDAVLNAVDATLPRTHDTGQTTMSRWFVSRNTPAFSLLRDIEDAEAGIIRENKVGQIAFESRAHRLTTPHDAPVATFGSGGLYVWDPQQEDPMAGIYNVVEASVRTFNESEDTLLATVVDIRNGTGGAAIAIPAGETKVITVEYPNPAGGSSGIAVKTWGIVDLEANTAADLSGTDVTANITPTRAEYADRIEITLENASSPAATAYVVVLRVHGTVIVEGDPVPVRKEDATSQDKFGKVIYPNPSRWLTDITEAEDYCTHLLEVYKNRTPRVTFTLKANYDAVHLAQAQSRDVSDRIHLDLDVTNYGLAIDGDFFIESIRHQMSESRLHQVIYQCRAVVEHTWPASAVPYTPNVVPIGVPDDLYVASIDPALHCTFGAGAWKYNENIIGARFRAKYFQDEQADAVDLRTIAEGGTLEHDPVNGMYVVDNIYANYLGVQYELDSAAEGYWYFAFQFTSRAGDSVWTDGNKTPTKVKDFLPTDATYASGPAEDWWVEVETDETLHRVRIHASRPKTNGEKIWSWRVQIKDNRTGDWYRLDEDIHDVSDGFSADVHYGDYDDNSPYGDIPHSLTLDGRRLTRESGTGLWGDPETMSYDHVTIGDLIILDTRGAVFDPNYCQWGTVDTIQGVKQGYDLDTATYFDVTGRFRTTVTTDLRLLVIRPPWGWEGKGYLGAAGMWGKDFWSGGQHGDKTTEIFVSDWIDVDPAVPLSAIEARVWFDNGFSVSDGGLITGAVSNDSGNPSGATSLQVLTHDDEDVIPEGYCVLQWNRDTTNYRGIYVVAAWFSSALPAEGPFDAERNAHAACVIEEGSCIVVRGDKSITVTRYADTTVVGRAFLIYTDDASPDSDLDGNIIAAEAQDKIILTAPFGKSGNFDYAVVKRWWDVSGGDTGNLGYFQWPVADVCGGNIEQTVWRTPPIPIFPGTYYVTLCSRNLFGLGTRLTSSSFDVPGPGPTLSGCVEITISSGEADTDLSLGRVFTVTSYDDYTLTDPVGTVPCGTTVLWMLTGSGVPTLGSKFRLMDGEVIDKSDGRDLLGAIYNGTDDQWDAFWKKGPAASSPA